MSYKDPEAQREYQRRWIARRRSRWLSENGPCWTCGSDQDLQVDHVDRTTKVDHRLWSWSRRRMDVELAKCQVLCLDCHKAKTRSENVQTKHGTYAMRNQHGCTCEECKEYVREMKRRSRARIAARRGDADW